MQAQEVTYIVPDADADYYIKAFVGSAFALKALDLILLIVHQSTLDLFFIDWEKPRKSLLDSAPPTQDEMSQYRSLGKRGAPSVWRTYFVVNEWVERQAVRQVRPFWQLFLLLLLLEVVGLGRLASAEQGAQLGDVEPGADDSVVFRFALAASLYLALGEFCRMCL